MQKFHGIYKIVLEFGDECGVVSKLRCIMAGGECGFEPVERSSVEKRQYIGYLSTVIGECVGTVVEVQEALGQEQLEFMGVLVSPTPGNCQKKNISRLC